MAVVSVVVEYEISHFLLQYSLILDNHKSPVFGSNAFICLSQNETIFDHGLRPTYFESSESKI